MAPKHITLHRDNYQTHGDITVPEGKANLEILQTADIVFFNGGDQSRHVRTWMQDNGNESVLLGVIRQRAKDNHLVLAGTSAGSMMWGQMTFGGGTSFGLLYFANSVGLAPKNVADGALNGSGLQDTRNGTKSLQYEYNAGKMVGFGMINFAVDTHFHARGRLGRLVPMLVNLQVSLGIGID